MSIPRHHLINRSSTNATFHYQPTSPLSLPAILPSDDSLPPCQEQIQQSQSPSNSIQEDAGGRMRHFKTSPSLGSYPFLLTPSDFEPLPKRTQEPIAPTTSKKKSFRCDQCQRTFTRLNNLKSHLTTHTAERPYKCDQCHLDFRRQYDLKRHLKLHTGEKPYICPYCSRSFARSDALNRHRRLSGGTTCHIFQVDPMEPKPTLRFDIKPKPQPDRNPQHTIPFVLLPSPPTTTTSIDSFRSEYDHLKKSMLALQEQHRCQQDEINALKSTCHDLQVENKVLTSLVVSHKRIE